MSLQFIRLCAFRHLITPLLAAALTTGCAAIVVPPSERPAAMKRHGTGDRPSPAAQSAGVSVGVPSRAWWQDLRDPSLNELIEITVGGNHDVKTALASVKASRALVDAANREALPQGSLGAQAQTLRPSVADVDFYRQGLERPPARRLFSVNQSLAWELDLFGRVGTASAVADRNADAAIADLHATTALLHAEVVRHYVGLRRYQTELTVLDEEAALMERRSAQLEVRVQAGLTDRREALAADSERARLDAERAAARSVVHVHAAALATLAGRSPSVPDPQLETLLAPAAMPETPPSASIVQPSDLLARRPDVARADAKLRASLGEAVLASRAHLPRLSLNLVYGVNAMFGDFGSSQALRYAAGPALSWDWLDAGRKKAREAAARAGSEAAWHGFEQTVLKALEESETSLRQWTATRESLEQSRRGEALALATRNYTEARVSAGMEPPVSALAEAVAHVRTRRATLIAQAETLNAFAQVQLALGAWQPDPSDTQVSAIAKR